MMTGTITIRRAEPNDKPLIAELLFEDDQPFVPVTPLASLDASQTFFVAGMEDGREVRAATSYEHWLSGCANEAAPPEEDTDVYELASSIVRSPMGGFLAPSPSMHEILTFVRLVSITGGEAGDENARGGFCLIAAILHDNRKSYDSLAGLGMMPIEAVPRWLEYEHRSWFPNPGRPGARDISQEAHYLWFPPSAADALVMRVAPYVDGEPLRRKPREGEGQEEAFQVRFQLPSVQRLVAAYGSMEVAARKLSFETLRPPPEKVRIGEGVF